MGRGHVKERLQKVLAAAGIASRRRAEELIAAGAVTVNGQVAHLGDSADPETDVILAGSVLIGGLQNRQYLALNKPVGYVTSLRSTHGERTVAELLPFSGRLFPVGRLDKLTSGLLLLTDDGEWSNIVTHPRYSVEKEYRATVHGHPSVEALRRLREGVPLVDGDITAPARVEVLARERAAARLSVTVVEGKKRQIRLMAAAVGHPVLTLHRVRVGTIELGDLHEGGWRPLRTTEVESIRAYGRGKHASGGAPTRSSGRH
jgi:23S rRNA pseudouridine2605 synthase